MKKAIIAVLGIVTLISCEQKKYGAFTVSGKISNTQPQKIFLQEIPFAGENPLIVDSATLKKDGTFLLRSMAKEEGLYRLALEQGGEVLLVNDGKSIRVNIDINKFREYSVQGSTASEDIHDLFDIYLKHANKINEMGQGIDSIITMPGNDSLVTAMRGQRSRQLELMKDEVKKFITRSNSPAAIYFAIGRFGTQMFMPDEIKAMVDNAANRFKEHSGLAKLKSAMAVQMAQQSHEAPYTLLNKQAPGIDLPTPQGPTLSLNSLKGKYVLVDFWASWCAPCRRENPNVVKAFNRFKDKNFTILGVSLDEEKSKWTEAISKDQLTWNHVSDLKYWDSEVVKTYQFNSIPFNVLVDPAGKIIASGLYGEALEKKLAEVLK